MNEVASFLPAGWQVWKGSDASAVTDIDLLGKFADYIHPQLYIFQAVENMPRVMERFTDKLELGKTTITRATVPVYVTIGVGSSGNSIGLDPKYPRMQVFNWWFTGATGFDMWQYFYGFDGRYLVLVNEFSDLFDQAGDKPVKASPTEILTVQPDNHVEVLCRKSTNKRIAWIGFFNFSKKACEIQLQPQSGWRISDNAEKSKRLEPWSVEIVKYVVTDKR